jgi:hypothetical protein
MKSSIGKMSGIMILLVIIVFSLTILNAVKAQNESQSYENLTEPVTISDNLENAVSRLGQSVSNISNIIVTDYIKITESINENATSVSPIVVNESENLTILSAGTEPNPVYLNQPTVLWCDYRSANSVILNANVFFEIDENNFTAVYNPLSGRYEYIYNSTEIGNKTVYCHASAKGFENASTSFSLEIQSLFPKESAIELPLGNYTPSSEAHCSNGKCWIALYSGIRFVYEDYKWKRVEDARSLKDRGFEVVYLEKDGEHDIEVEDFNYTDIKFKVSAKIAKDAPFKIDSIEKKVVKIKDPFKKEEISFKLDDVFSHTYTFGEHSTTIKLQTADTENLEDTYVDSGYADINYGSANNLDALSSQWIYIKFNLTKVPSGQTINSANLSLYDYSTTYATVFVYEVSNQTWIEETNTWNNKPSVGSSIGSKTVSLTWVFWNVTSWVSNQYNAGNSNVSFMLNSSFSEYFYSKEYTNTALRPYLNITYTDTTPPVVTIQSPLNTSYPTTPVWFNVSLNENGSWCGRSLDGAANVTMSNDSLTHFYNLTTSLAEGGHNIRFCCNDTSNNMNCSVIQYFSVDLTPPTYSKNTVNNTIVGKPTLFSLEWNDILLHPSGWWIFSSNNSGYWRNYTLQTPNINYNKGYNSTESTTNSSPDSATTALLDANYSSVNKSDNSWLSFSVSSSSGFTYTHYRWVFNFSDFVIGNLSKLCYRVEAKCAQTGDCSCGIDIKNITSGSWVYSGVFTSASDANITKCYTNISEIINSTDKTFQIATTASADAFEGSCIATYGVDYIEINVSNTNTNLTFTATPQNSTFQLNLTSTPSTVVGWCFYAGDNVGNWNSTSCQNPFNLTTTDEPPTWSGNTSSYPSTYSPTTISEFNITCSDNIGIHNALIEMNYSGVNNYSMSNATYGGNIYNYSIVLPAGTFYWKAYCNDTYSNINASDTWAFTINKASSPLVLSNNLSWSGTYPSASNTTASGCPSGVACNLYRNDTGSVSNPDLVLLGAGAYNYTYNTSGNQNYSANSTSNILTISKGNPSSNLNIYMDGFSNNATIVYPSIANVSANETITGDADCTYTLWRNNSQLIQGSNIWNYTKLGNGTYAFKYNMSNTCNNWTLSSSQILYLYVNKGIANLALTSNVTWSATYPSASNVTGYGCLTDGASDFNCTLYRNTSSINPVANSSGSVAASELILLGAGSHLYIWNMSIANPANWTFNSTNNTLVITLGTSDVKTFIDDSATNKTVAYPTSVTIKGNSSITVTPPSFNLYVFNITPSSPFVNLSSSGNPATLTVSLGNATYRVVYNTSGNENWTSANNDTLYLIVNKSNNAPIINNITLYSENLGGSENYTLVVKYVPTDDSQNYTNNDINFWYFDDWGQALEFTNTSLVLNLTTNISESGFPFSKNLTLNDTANNKTVYNVSINLQKSWFYQNESGTTNRTYQLVARNATWNNTAPSGYPINISWNFSSPSGSINNITAQSGMFNLFNNAYTILSNSTWKAYNITAQIQNPDTLTGSSVEFSDTDYNSTNASDNNRKITSYNGGFYSYATHKFEYNFSKLSDFNRTTVTYLKYCYVGNYNVTKAGSGYYGKLRYYNYSSGAWTNDKDINLNSDTTLCTEFTSGFLDIVNSSNFFKWAAQAYDYDEGANSNATIITNFVNLTIVYGSIQNQKVVWYGDWINETNESWRQDTTRTTTANSTAFVTHNIWLNNSWNFTINNLNIQEYLPDRSGWTCNDKLTTINVPNSTNTSYNQSINCTKNNVIQPVNTTDWVQDNSSVTIAGGYAYIKGKSYFNNTDNIIYSNVAVNSTSYYNNTLNRSIDWNCSWNSTYQTNLSFSIYSVNQTADYSVLCNKNNTITKTDQPWYSDNSTEQNITKQWIIKKVNGTNTDNLAYVNVNYTISEFPNCKNNYTCNVTSENITVSPGTWQRWINASNTSTVINTTWTNRYSAPDYYQNITINDTGDIAFYNITGWSFNFNDTNITAGTDYIKYWNGTGWTYITPTENDTNCNTSPTYIPNVTNNGTFYVCKKDANNNGKIDYFRFKIPYASNTTLQILQVGGLDTTPPNYSVPASINYSYPKPGEYLKLYSKWQDDVALSWYKFEWNASGTPANETNGTLSGISDWANVTLLISTNRKAGDLIAYKFYVNDSSNNWNSTNNTFIVWGWSNITEINVSNLYGSNKLNRSITPVTCRVMDANNSQPIQNYPVNFYVNNTTWSTSSTNYTNQTGYAIWYYNSYSNLGSYTIKCNITDNDTLYYNDSINQQSTDIEVWRILNLNLTVSPTEIYRNDTFSPFTSTFQANLTDENGGISGVSIDFKVSGSSIGQSTTGSDGIATRVYNPSNTSTPGNYSVFSTNYSAISYSYPSNDTKYIIIKGLLYPNIDSPNASYFIFHKNETINLLSTITDENGNGYTTLSPITFNWTLGNDNIYYGTSDDTTWQVPVSHSSGQFNLNLTTNKTWYDTGWKNYTIEVWNYYITVNTPQNLTIWHRTENVNLNASLRDEKNNNIVDYSQFNWILNGTNIANDNVTSWNVLTNQNLGLSELNSTARVDYASGYYYITNVTWIYVYGWSNVTDFSPLGTFPQGTLINVTCRVRDANTSENITNYTVNFYKDDILNATNLTNSSGIAVWHWDTTKDSAAPHNIKCNITDNSSLNYNYSYPNEQNGTIELSASLDIDQVIKQHDEIYRNNSCGGCSPNSTVIIVHVTEAALGNSSDANVSFYNSTNYLDSCLTNSSGYCNITFNPPDDTTAQNYTIYLNATKPPSFNPSPTIQTWVIVKGKLFVDITNPIPPITYHKTQNASLTASVTDENSNQISATVNWYNETSQLLNDNGSSVTGSNTYWIIPSNYSLGDNYVINATATKQYFDSASFSIQVSIYGWSNITLLSPADGSYVRGTIINTLCRVTDANSSIGIGDYQINFWNDSTYAYSNNSNQTGYGNYSWDTSNIPVGQHKLNCTIAGNSTSHYDVSTSNSYTTVNLTGNLTTQLISVSQSSIYRNDTWAQLNGKNYLSNITVRVIDEYLNPVNNSNVSFYQNESYIGYCYPTNSSGYCTYTYNASDTLTPGNYSIKFNSSKQYYNYSTTNETYIAVLGKLYPNITYAPQKSYRNDNLQLNSTIIDENGNIITPSYVIWYLNQTNISSLDNTQQNITWSIPINQQTGQFIFNVSVNRTWYDSNYNVTQTQIWTKANITLYLPSSTTFDRGSDITYYANVTDYYNNSPVSNYNCSWWLDNSIINSSLTNLQGTCNWTWQTNCNNITRDYAGLHIINSTIGSNSSVFYDPNINNSYKDTTLQGFLKIRIDSPQNNSVWHKTDSLWLNSTTNSECSSETITDQSVNWTLNNTQNINTGINYLWTILSNQTLGPYFINSTVNKTFYYSIYNTSNIQIWGWSNVSWIYPNGSQPYGNILNLTCGVTDANNSTSISSYNVSFWKYNTSSGSFDFVNSNITYNGNATYNWNTAPEQLGLYMWKCNITDNSTLYYNASSKESFANITLTDLTPPTIANLSIIPNASFETNYNYTNITVDATDNFVVDKVWAQITLPNTTKLNVTMNNISANTYRGNYTPVIGGLHNVTIYANDTSSNTANTSSNFTAVGNTTGILLQTPSATVAYDLNRTYNFTFIINATINNTGYGTMRYVNISVITPLPTGYYSNSTFETCPDLKPGENCTKSFEINVTLSAPKATSKWINLNSSWKNPDYSITTQGNNTSVYVTLNTILYADKSSIVSSVNHNTSRVIDNFTIYPWGNTGLNNIEVNKVEGNLSEDWVTFYNYSAEVPPWNIPTYTNDKLINVNISIPNGQDPGLYWANYTINATGSFGGSNYNCTPANKCWKFLMLNITVPNNNSWNLTPNETNITVPFGLTVNFTNTLSNIGNINKTWINTNPEWVVDPHENQEPTVDCPSSVFVEKTMAENITCNVSGGTGGNYTYKLTFYNSSADPNSISVYINMEALDPPPKIDNPSVSPTLVDENYESTTVSASISDNIQVSMVWINITRPDSTIEIKNFSAGGSSYQLSYNYTPTQIGTYNLTIYSNDSAAGINQSQMFNFTSIGSTNISISSNITNTTINGITQDQGNSSTVVNISVNNTGQAKAYWINRSLELPSGWTATLNPVQFGNLTEGVYVSNLSTITVPKNTSPADYTIIARTNWTNPDNTFSTNTTSFIITVASNPILNIVQNIINMTLNHGTSNSTNFTLNSTGNTNVTNILINCTSANCTDLNVSFSTYPTSLSPMSSANIAVNATAYLGFQPGNYPLTTNASGTGTSDIVILNITVPVNKTWNRTPDNFSQLSVGLNSTGDIGTINITNYGNLPITFNVSVINTTENATNYIFVNTSSITVNEQSLGYVKVSYTSPSSIVPSSVNYTVNVSISNSTADPSYSLNTTASIKVYKFKVNIISPNQTNPVSLYAGNITTIYANATLGDTTLESGENITWTVNFVNTTTSTNCPLSGSPNYISNYWIINCTAPSLTDAKNYTLTVTGNYTNLSFTPPIIGALASDSQINATWYEDITSPVINSISSPSTEVLGNVSIDSNVTDNLAVDKVTVQVRYPNSTKINYTMNPISTNIWEWNLTSLTDIGDYDLIVYANDTKNNQNYLTGWFEIYATAWFNGTMVEANNTPISAAFNLYRVNTTQNLTNFTTNASGKYAQLLHKRYYDFNIRAFGNEINLSNVSINSNLYNATKLDDVPTDLIGSSASRVSKVMYIESILNYTTGTIVLNYTGAAYTSSSLGVYQCSDWDYTNRNCTSSWTRISSTRDPSAHTLTFSASGNLSSAYAAAEFICGDGVCDTNYGESNAICPTDCPSPPSGPTGPSGGGGGGGGGVTPIQPEVTIPLSLSTSLIEVRLYPGEYQISSIGITNNKKESTEVSLSVDGDIWPFTLFEKDKIVIGPKQTEYAKIKFFTMPTTIPGVYNGNIIIKTADNTYKISVILRVEYEREKLLDVKVEAITKEVLAGQKLKYQVTLYNLGLTKRVDVFINYTVKSVETDKIIAVDKETMAIETTLSFIRMMAIPEKTEPGLYTIEATAWYENKSASSVASFSVVSPPWIFSLLLMIFTNWITYVILFVAIPCFYLGWKTYEKWKVEKKVRARYIKPININKLPTKGLWLGKVAETNTNAFFDESKLTTHVIIAGGTGSGKTVAGMDIAEECLKKGISVIVFDPTAQWTGFIRPSKDKAMQSLYAKFGIKPEESRGFKGTIVQVKDPFLKVEVEKYIKEGEITVFVLNKLTPDQLDYFVRKTIDYMFTIPWPESRQLKTLFVFDEIHRLLPKYAKQTGISLGGGEGYLAIERACREFRKWGLGLIMISQVLLDFRGAIRAVIATEAQLRTKYEGDIERIKTKYGWEYSTAIPKLEVGTGMIQNPEYNDGKPWFIRFRPLLHDSFRLTEEELNMYEDYMKEIEDIGKKIETLKSRNIDTYDMELELKLALDKVKTAQMRMAETYIESVKSRIKIIEERS